MSIKRGVSEDVYGTALQRLSDTAKAALPESQCPVAEAHALRYASRVWTPIPSGATNSVLFGVRPARWTMSNELIQGHEWEAYVALARSSVTEHGMAYRARAPGSRSRDSSRGSDAPPGKTGEPSTGRSRHAEGGSGIGNHAVGEMPKGKLELIFNRRGMTMATTGELLDIERVTSSSERGGWKRTAMEPQRAGRLLYRTSGFGAARRGRPRRVG